MSNNNGSKNNDFTIMVDLSNTTLRQTTICEKPNPNYVPPNDSNLLLFTLQKTPKFNDIIDDTIEDQPERLIWISMENTIKGRQIIPNIILGYIVKVDDVNVFYEVLYSENYGTRSVDTKIHYKGKFNAIDMKKSFLIVYLDIDKNIKLVGNQYLTQLLTSIDNTMISNLNIKLGAHFSKEATYMKEYYSLIAWDIDLRGRSNLLVHLNPEGREMEPTPHPFTKMKTSLITIKKEKDMNQVYCIRNVHPPETVKKMREYVNSPEFKALYTHKSGATNLSKALNEVKSGDITQEYDRFIFFFMKKMDMMINFKNWIRTLANAIGVDAYISFVQGSGLNVQINVMENHSNKNMNLGVHTDYNITNNTLYPLNTSNRRRVARTILTYVDLYARGKPVIGFTTKITAMSQNESQNKLIEYSLKELCSSFIRLTNYIKRLEAITIETENSIKKVLKRPYYPRDYLKPIFIPSTSDHMTRATRAYFTMIDSILLPDIDDTFYYFGEQREKLKIDIDQNQQDPKDNYRDILNEINDIFKKAVYSNPDITNWNTTNVVSEIRDITQSELFYDKFTYCKKKIEEYKNSKVIDRFKQLFSGSYATNNNEPKKRPFEVFTELVSDVDTFVSTYFEEPDRTESVNFIREELKELFNTADYQNVLYGNACPFVDGGMVYFNGQNTHTLDAGVGKRISIVYKVSFVDRDPDNKLSIEEREEKYFKEFQDDLPLSNPTKTYNNTPRRSPGLSRNQYTLNQYNMNPKNHALPISINNAKSMLQSLQHNTPVKRGGRTRRSRHTHKQTKCRRRYRTCKQKNHRHTRKI